MGDLPNQQQTLAIIGAGPKALAIGAKAAVLKKLGFQPPKILIIEKSEVAHHWVEGSCFTNGKLPLGTSPDKDVGFPYYSFCWGDKVNKRVNFLMQRYAWQNYLIAKHRYADWVDRGSPAPTHRDWADYLTWVYDHIQDQVEYVQAEVNELDIVDEKWCIRAAKSDGTKVEIEADGLVCTGPGEIKLPFDIPKHERILNYSDFWCQHKQLGLLRDKNVALVGAGENSATIAVTLGQADPSIRIDVISPSATTYTRGESYVENHIYTDPFRGNWMHLTRKDRRDFIQRTDRGVFSVTTKRQLDQLRNVEMVPGMFTGVRVDSLDQLLLDIEYNDDSEQRIYDYIILAVGFNHTFFVGKLLSEGAKSQIKELAGIKTWTTHELEARIDENLALEGAGPALHLPMLAGLNQGPGFANLSCLGRLSDHILARYVRMDSSSMMAGPLLLSLSDSEMNMDDMTS